MSDNKAIKRPKVLERGRFVSLPASRSEVDVPEARFVSTMPLEPAARPPMVGSNAPGNSPGRVFTGVGASIQASNTSLANELRTIKEQLAEFDGATPLKHLDPKRIRHSQWANRHEAEFTTPGFEELKKTIAIAGGNIQPIKVRPIKDDASADYELVFGHRRHRACFELGLPVLALVKNVGDQELWLDMARENLARKDMSPWEQGSGLARAIDKGLFPSNRQLAKELGIDQSNVSKLLQLARLPLAVVDAFESPLELQQAWAKGLSDAVQKDPDGVLSRAKAISLLRPRMQPKKVFQELVAAGTKSSVDPIVLRKNGEIIAVLKKKGKKGVSIDLPSFSDILAAEVAIRSLFGL